MEVLLGLPDEKISEKGDETLSWSVNKIGGIPNWMTMGPSSYPVCSVCNKLLYLVVQIYCPLESSVYHRTLHIFACTTLDCWDNPLSWKAYRSQCTEIKSKQDNQVSEQAKDNDWGEEEWCSDAADWGLQEPFTEDMLKRMKEEQYKKDMECMEQNVMRVELDPLEKKQTLSSGISLLSSIPKFIPHYIFALTEPEEETAYEDNHIQDLLDNYEKQEGMVEYSVSDCLEMTTECYEKTSPRHGDNVFCKFQKRISRSPSQCLRYQWNGQPLLLTSQTKPSTDLDSVPLCRRCGSPRVFELQLLSSIAWVLREKTIPSSQSDNYSASLEPYQEWDNGEICARQERIECCSVPLLTDTRLEFGTVFIYSCSKSCWMSVSNFDVPVEEFVIVQSDPDRYITAKAKE